MRFPGKATVAGLSLSLTAGTAWAADVCARAPDLVALQVAALQQQLMVAALTCDDVSLYNSFVTAYQKDLVASDEALQAFFDRFGSEEGTPAYHSFKTKMANIYSARSASDKNRYCANVRATFGPALKAEKLSLASFAMSQPSTVNEPYTNCGDTVAGGAMVTRTPVVAPTPPSNLLTAQNAAAAAKGAAVASAPAAPPADKPLSAALSSAPPSTSAAAAAEAKQTAQLNNSQAATPTTNAPPSTTTSGRSPYYQGYGVGYARERARQQAAARQQNDTTKTAEAANTGEKAATTNSNQQRRCDEIGAQRARRLKPIASGWRNSAPRANGPPNARACAIATATRRVAITGRPIRIGNIATRVMACGCRAPKRRSASAPISFTTAHRMTPGSITPAAKARGHHSASAVEGDCPMKCAAVAAWSAILLVGVATAAYSAAQGDAQPPKGDQAQATKSLEALFGKTLISIDGSTIEIIARRDASRARSWRPTARCSAPTSSSSIRGSARSRTPAMPHA